MGIHNRDGSTGFNVSATATLFAGEGTLNVGGTSVTLGGSVSVGGEVSVGVRDIDEDGEGELCVRLAAKAATGGWCIERP